MNRCGSLQPHFRSRRLRGQSLAEFALVLPLLLMLVGGIVQYGIVMATQHALIQIGRDVGRWAATQGATPCSSATTATPRQPVTQADLIAQQAGMLGYSAGTWNTSNFKVYADNTDIKTLAPPNTEGVEVVWSFSGTCPPADNSTTAFVTVRVSHRAPIVLPGFAYLPAFGTCDASGCYLASSSSAQFRMEPPPVPLPAPSP